MLSIALYQPDIPQNVGAMIRLCACMNVGLEVIEPCSFPWDVRKIRQSAMDYIDHVNIVRHTSWDAFTGAHEGRRVVLMSTKAAVPYVDFEFRDDDILLAGSESAGVPQEVHESVDARVLIPMHGVMRSLNIVNASSMILGESLRQTRWSAV
ncbi:MAG TPA: tRNA (cytidine(34)-2'-O)-methyltransferase [Alphaproteobacteria bacterium]|nr:tRNA (cytidine(34)-2'-O)-methyltransferase [Alphaproteobacteria bacterium]USO06606.1 MAG: tRNA (cytidine(34)-2'-O)-methyltransferase [Rhodospirillales bacterium]HOO80970.1 tRNA (cytidine(34)-2'-O)-methyltransferase [Alphaproteobacteria bacterium]